VVSYEGEHSEQYQNAAKNVATFSSELNDECKFTKNKTSVNKGIFSLPPTEVMTFIMALYKYVYYYYYYSLGRTDSRNTLFPRMAIITENSYQITRK